MAVDFSRISDVLSTLATYPYNIVASSVVLGTAILVLRRHYGGGVCRSSVQLNGKTVIITGGNCGIGKQTAIDLAKRNARVILACRDEERGEKAAREVREISCNKSVEYRQLDLSSLTSVRQFATGIIDGHVSVDILINNAGVMRCPFWKTEDGFEMQFGVNHLGHFLLTNLLLDRIKESPGARIVNVSSKAYLRVPEGLDFEDLNSEKKEYNTAKAYGYSKLANIYFTRALADRLKGTDIIVSCLHPGVVWTELGRHMEKSMSIFMKLLVAPLVLLCFKSTWQGAQTTIHCAVSEDMVGLSGKYFADCRELPLATAVARDCNAAEKLWDISERMVGLK